MSIKINGVEHRPDLKIDIKERLIKNVKVKMPNNLYQAKAVLNSAYGTVEITGSTLHRIIIQSMVQNVEYRCLVKGMLDDLEKNEELYIEEAVA